MSEHILKVDEKNCYPSKNGCQHVVQVKSPSNGPQNVLMNSEEIYNLLNATKDCPLHIILQHESFLKSKIIG